MKAALSVVALALLSFVSLPIVSARADVLTIGDPAPPIVVGDVVKGTADLSGSSGKIRVVEFWATWCGPCKDAIPHLTAISKKYPDVNFLGVSVLEQNQNFVKPFVDGMGAKMDYAVATDSVPAGGVAADGIMEKTWLLPAAQPGIPTTFIVGRDGRIDWIGHPMLVDEPLRQITAGTWDRAVALAQIKPGQERQAHVTAANAQIAIATKAGSMSEVIAAVERASLSDPSVESQLGEQKFGALRTLGRDAEALAYGYRLIDLLAKGNTQAYLLNSFAWNIVDPAAKVQPDAKYRALSLKAAQTADDVFAHKDSAIADTLAAALYASGDTAGAIETERRAIRLSKGTEWESNPDLQKNLNQYLKAASDGAKATSSP